MCVYMWTRERQNLHLTTYSLSKDLISVTKRRIQIHSPKLCVSLG